MSTERSPRGTATTDTTSTGGSRFTAITLAQIRKAAAFADFGEADPARVVCVGLLQIAGGFATGYTVKSILIDLGLVGRKGGGITKIGRLFLYDLYRNCDPLIALEQP